MKMRVMVVLGFLRFSFTISCIWQVVCMGGLDENRISFMNIQKKHYKRFSVCMYNRAS